VSIDPALHDALTHDWETIRPRLLAVAFSYSRARDVADDLVNETWLALREGRRTWNRDKQPSLFGFAASVVGSLWANARKGGRKKYEVSAPDNGPEYSPPSAPNPEKLNTIKQEREKRLEALVASFEGDEICRKLVALFVDGVDGASEQASALGVSAEDIYKARKRLKTAMDRLDNRER
jgi:DNA-directed RNA polymerase specialized sigma24 family protein